MNRLEELEVAEGVLIREQYVLERYAPDSPYIVALIGAREHLRAQIKQVKKEQDEEKIRQLIQSIPEID